MSPWRPESRSTRAVIAFDDAGHAWRLAAGTGTAAAPMVQGSLQDLEQALGKLPAGSCVEVVAANAVALHWLQAVPGALRSLDELRLAAMARCTQLHGGTAHDWWLAGDWRARRPFVCVALPQVRVQALAGALARARLRPRWTTAWAAASRSKEARFASNGWSALRTPQRLLLWHCRDGHVTALAGAALDVQAPAAEAEDRAARLMQMALLHDDALAAGAIGWRHLAAADEARAALQLGCEAAGAAA